MDALGGEFISVIVERNSCFLAYVLYTHLPLAIDVLGDMVTSSLLAPEDVEAEREVILDEIAMHDDDPEDVVSNVFSTACWGSTPLGRPVAGTADSIRALSRSAI